MTFSDSSHIGLNQLPSQLSQKIGLGDYGFGFLSFVSLDANAPKFFGFSEFLAGLALMALVWTIADIRYRFRVSIAPIPLQGITFFVVAAVGVFTLVIDFWRAEQWLVPQGNVLTPALWQALLAGLFLMTFLTWSWFAFIHPPIYGKSNAERYAKTLYKFILKGVPSELAVIADELTESAKSLVHHATVRDKYKSSTSIGDDEVIKNISKVQGYADDIFLLIADKRFCRTVVETSPTTVRAIFYEIGITKKYGIPVEIFAKNIVNEALINRDSFLFHEVQMYDSGLIGYHKPLSQAMFANYRMVETIGTLLDPDIVGHRQWDSTQWEAYCRVVLITLIDYVENISIWEHSYAIYRAMGNIEKAVFDLYKLNGREDSVWDDDVPDRLRIVVDFIINVVEILDKKGVPKHLPLRVRQKRQRGNIYDHLAKLVFEIIRSASLVHHPKELCWSIQHNSVWSMLFNFDVIKGSAGKVLKFKVRRLIYDEVIAMNRFPNFMGAQILGFCLNVMGLTIRADNNDRDSRAIQKVILSWTRKYYVWLYSYNSRVAEACLVDGFIFDQEHLRLVRNYPVDGLRRTPYHVYFELDPSPTASNTTDSP